MAGGVFIPSLLTGAAMGRVFGQWLNASSISNHVVDAGVYSFIGPLTPLILCPLLLWPLYSICLHTQRRKQLLSNALTRIAESFRSRALRYLQPRVPMLVCP